MDTPQTQLDLAVYEPNLQSTMNENHLTTGDNGSDARSLKKKLAVLVLLPEREQEMSATEERLYQELLRGLDQQQHNVTVMRITDGAQACEDGFARPTDMSELSFPRSNVHVDGRTSARRSYELYSGLKRLPPFDIVCVPDRGGVGYYSMLAKKQGLFFASTVFVTCLFGPTMWTKSVAAEFLDDIDDICTDFAEQQCIEHTDGLLAPNNCLIDWISHRGWSHSKNYFVPRTEAVSSEQIQEIVLAGHLEKVDGLQTFCDAIDDVASIMRKPFKVTFLGTLPAVTGRSPEQYIRDRSAQWAIPAEIVICDSRQAVIEYLSQGPQKLCVLASRADRSAATAMDCAASGVPFAYEKEAAGAKHFAQCSQFEFCDAKDLASQLLKTLQGTISPQTEQAKISAHSAINIAQWLTNLCLEHDQSNAASDHSSALSNATPLVTVVLAHRDRPQLLKQAIDSLALQDYPNFEVIVADDGSRTAAAIAVLDDLEAEFAQRGWRILRLQHSSVGAARTAAAQVARGEFLLFMDDDNLAKPQEISTFTRAILHCGADLLTCVIDTFEGPEAPPAEPKLRWAVLGPCALAGMYENVFGDTNCFVRRQVYLELGGFPADPSLCHEDWAFFARAALAGHKLQVVPEALFWYRVASDSKVRTSGLFRGKLQVMKEYSRFLPQSMRLAPDFGIGLRKKVDSLVTLWHSEHPPATEHQTASEHQSATEVDDAGTDEADSVAPERQPVRISVIIPIYNGKKYLQEAIESVAKQTLLPCQLILVDDESTDDSMACVDATDIPFPVICLRQKNAGQSAARNHGASLATGDLLAFLDQDDIWYPNHLDQLQQLFAETPSLSWAVANVDRIDQHGHIVSRAVLDRQSPNGNSELVQFLNHDLFMLPSACLIRKDAFASVGGFDDRLSGYEDDDLFLRMFWNGHEYGYVRTALGKWRIYNSSCSYSERMNRSRRIYADKLISMFPDDPEFGEWWVRDVIAVRFFNNAMGRYHRDLERKRPDLCAEALKDAEVYARLAQFDFRMWIKLKLMRNPTFYSRFFKVYRRVPTGLRALLS